MRAVLKMMRLWIGSHLQFLQEVKGGLRRTSLFCKRYKEWIKEADGEGNCSNPGEREQDCTYKGRSCVDGED